jgi:putative ATP-binding cassette transporter
MESGQLSELQGDRRDNASRDAVEEIGGAYAMKNVKAL